MLSRVPNAQGRKRTRSAFLYIATLQLSMTTFIHANVGGKVSSRDSPPPTMVGFPCWCVLLAICKCTHKNTDKIHNCSFNRTKPTDPPKKKWWNINLRFGAVNSRALVSPSGPKTMKTTSNPHRCVTYTAFTLKFAIFPGDCRQRKCFQFD